MSIENVWKAAKAEWSDERLGELNKDLQHEFARDEKENQMEYLKALKGMYFATRCYGSTTWLIESVIKNPRVIVVLPTVHHANNMHRMYLRKISEMPWVKRTFIRLTKKHNPLFIGLSEIHQTLGRRVPVVFDNSVLEGL